MKDGFRYLVTGLLCFYSSCKSQDRSSASLQDNGSLSTPVIVNYNDLADAFENKFETDNASSLAARLNRNTQTIFDCAMDNYSERVTAFANVFAGSANVSPQFQYFTFFDDGKSAGQFANQDFKAVQAGQATKFALYQLQPDDSSTLKYLLPPNSGANNSASLIKVRSIDMPSGSKISIKIYSGNGLKDRFIYCVGR